MKKFNINSIIYIQITDDGWRYLKENYPDDYVKACIKDKIIIIDGESWYRLQCHEVFSTFPINYGGQVKFNSNILIRDVDLEDKG